MSGTQHGSFTFSDFRLQSGEVLRQVTIAYCTRGRLAADGRNAVLVTHGYTSGHRMIESGAGSSEGSWSELVGPGAPVHPVRAVHAAEVSREVLRTGRSVRSLRNEDAPGSQERRPPPSFSRVLPPSDEGAGHDLQSKRREALGRRVRPRGLLRDGSAFRCRTGVDPDRRILPR